MSYSKKRLHYLEKNKLVVKVMMSYLDDFEFLYYCIGFDVENLVQDVEDVIVNLIDLQGDNIHYTPLTIA